MSIDYRPYLEEAKKAGVPIDFMERIINYGVVLHPKQLVASAAARLCDLPDGPTEVGYGGARGGGKSHWGIVQIAVDDCQRQQGLKVLVLRKVGKANKENFEDLRGRILMKIPHKYNRQENILYFNNGSKIVLGHYQSEGDIDAYLGLEYDVILVEEATTLTMAKYKAIKTCLRTSKKNWRPRMYTTTNPGGVGHQWYKEKFIQPMRKGTQDKTLFVQATVYDNYSVNVEYRAELEELTGWQKRAWLYGDWDIAAGQYFTTFREDTHVIKPFDVSMDARFILSYDHGFTHWAVAQLHAVIGENIYTVAERRWRKKTIQTIAGDIHNMLAQFGLSTGDLWRIVTGQDTFAKKHSEKNKIRSVADQFKDHGIKFRPADVDRVNGAQEMLSRLGDPYEIEEMKYETGSLDWYRFWPTWFIFDTCTDLINTMPAMVHDPHRPEDVDKVDADEDGYGGDDSYDCARMGLMASKKKRILWAAS